MTVKAEKAKWAAMRRMAEVLRDHIGAELEAIGQDPEFSGLTLDEPPEHAYFILEDEEDLEEHEANSPVAIYVYPFEDIDPVTTQSTGGGDERIVRYDREFAVVVRIPKESAAPAYENFKAFGSRGRDRVRLSLYLGAVSRVMYSRARDGVGITLIKESRVDEGLDLSTVSTQPEMFGRSVWDVTQRVLVPQNNA
jgi:hypothetical protein